MEREAVNIQEDTEQRLAECERQLKNLGDFLEKFCPKQIANIVANTARMVNAHNEQIAVVEIELAEDQRNIQKLRKKLKKCKRK